MAEAGYQAVAPDSINSMHADRIAGRLMEIVTRNGGHCPIGSHTPDPLNGMIVDLLQAAQG
jgi:2-dehydropantoate 2-reductase